MHTLFSRAAAGYAHDRTHSLGSNHLELGLLAASIVGFGRQAYLCEEVEFTRALAHSIA